MGGLEADTRLIREIVKFAGVTPAAIARTIGVAKTTISRPYSGKATARLSGPTLEKLKTHYPDYPGWTTEIEQRMPFREADGAKGCEDAASGDYLEIEMIMLARGIAKTSAGAGISIYPTTKRFPRDFVHMFSDVAADQLMLAYGIGDNMSPTIGEGDLLLIDKSHDAVTAGDQVWAVNVNGVASINRVRVEAENIRLLCDNRNIPDHLVSEHEIKIIGRVAAIMKRM